MNTLSPRHCAAIGRSAPAPAPLRRVWLSAAFTLFNTLRIAGYLPTLLAILSSGHADQHSLITWLVFFGGNATMAMWLHEQNGGRINRAVAVNAFNAFMCAAIAACIAWIRWIAP